MELGENARRFLQQPRFAVVGTNPADGPPQLSVVWYRMDGDDLLFVFSRGSAKEKNLRRAPYLSACVEDGYRYVTLSGLAVIEEDEGTTRALLRDLASRYLTPAEGEVWLASDENSGGSVTVRLKPEHIVTYGI